MKIIELSFVEPNGFNLESTFLRGNKSAKVLNDNMPYVKTIERLFNRGTTIEDRIFSTLLNRMRPSLIFEQCYYEDIAFKHTDTVDFIHRLDLLYHNLIKNSDAKHHEEINKVFADSIDRAKLIKLMHNIIPINRPNIPIDEFNAFSRNVKSFNYGDTKLGLNKIFNIGAYVSLKKEVESMVWSEYFYRKILLYFHPIEEAYYTYRDYLV